MSTEAFWMDDDGRPSTIEDATRAEITERDDEGIVLKRTYMDLTAAPQDLSTLSELSDENTDDDAGDLIKAGAWDIWAVEDGQWRLAETKDDLLSALGLASVDLRAQRVAVGQFLALPAWEPAPQALKDEVYQWLIDTRQE